MPALSAARHEPHVSYYTHLIEARGLKKIPGHLRGQQANCRMPSMPCSSTAVARRQPLLLGFREAAA